LEGPFGKKGSLASGSSLRKERRVRKKRRIGKKKELAEEKEGKEKGRRRGMVWSSPVVGERTSEGEGGTGKKALKKMGLRTGFHSHS